MLVGDAGDIVSPAASIKREGNTHQEKSIEESGILAEHGHNFREGSQDSLLRKFKFEGEIKVTGASVEVPSEQQDQQVGQGPPKIKGLPSDSTG